MSSVDDFVRERITIYPTLFNDRTSVLHFILCVVGNGYAWHEGAPVSVFDDHEEAWTREKYLSKEIYFDFEDEEGRAIKRANAEKRADEYEAIVANVDTLMYLRNKFSEENNSELLSQFYPQSDYALLMNIPADVTGDWALACEEIRELAKENGWVF